MHLVATFLKKMWNCLKKEADYLKRKEKQEMLQNGRKEGELLPKAGDVALGPFRFSTYWLTIGHFGVCSSTQNAKNVLGTMVSYGQQKFCFSDDSHQQDQIQELIISFK